MKLSISITTYNRPNILLAQLKELQRQLEAGHYEAEILVTNDGSVRKYTKVQQYLKAMPFQTRYDRFTSNQGKQGHWRIVNHIFSWHRKREFDLVLYLQDDCVLHRDFLTELITQWQSIKNKEKVCLNYILEKSRLGCKVWTPVYPRVYNYGQYRLYRTGWFDLHFLANREFFEVLNWHVHPIPQTRWADDPTLSSGVGRQLSWRLYRQRKTMWQVTSSLATHGIHESYMNPIAREKNPNFKSI